MRTTLIPVVILVILLGTVAGVQLLRASGRHEGAINTRDGVAIEGYDPVAYFTRAQPTPGDPAYSYEWSGALWQFASAENRDLFAANPERYAPAYGGYCAWAVSGNSLAGIDPESWHIEDDRLFLNYSRRLNRRFVEDITERVQRADENWPPLKKRLTEKE